MASFADIAIRINTDLKGFKTGMQNAQDSIAKLGKKMQGLGTTLSVGLTAPLAALGAVSLKNFDAQAKAISQLEAGLKSTGATVGYTSAQLQGFASELQNISLFGDEAILKDVTAQLLTFTNIAGEQFQQTQQAALDLATRLDGDLKSASIQLGKALNDPVANLSALARSGIQFSDDQKKVINSLATTGRLAEAQTLILGELQKQYGGSAAAAAAAGTGPLVQLQNTLGDLSEEFGAIIMDGLRPFVDWLKGLAAGFATLSPETKKWIVIIGGIAAAIGPLLALAGTILPAISTGFALITGPVGLIVAGLVAIGVIIYKNWAPIKQTLIDIANYFIDLYNESTVFRIAVEAVVLQFKNLFDVGKFVLGVIGSAFSTIGKNIVDTFKNIGEIIKAIFTGNFDEIPDLLKKALSDTTGNFKDFFKKVSDDFGGLKENITVNIQDGINNAIRGKKYKIAPEAINTDAVAEKVAEAVQTGLNGGSPGGGRAREQKLEIQPQGLAEIKTTGPQVSLLTTYQKELTDFEVALVEFNMKTADILTKTAENFVTGFADIIGGIAAGTAGFSDVAGLIIGSVADLATQLGKAAIQIGITMGALKFAFKTPGAAIATGVALVAFAALLRAAATKYVGNFSTGGIVGGTSFTGDRLTAGVNSGELILNIAQQKNLAGALRRSDATIIGGTLTADGRMLKVLLNNVDTYSNRVT